MTPWISMKRENWMFLSREETLLTVGVDRDNGTDPRIFFSASLTLRDRTFIHIFINSSGNNMDIDVKNQACAQMGLLGMGEYNMILYQITGFFLSIYYSVTTQQTTHDNRLRFRLHRLLS